MEERERKYSKFLASVFVEIECPGSQCKNGNSAGYITASVVSSRDNPQVPVLFNTEHRTMYHLAACLAALAAAQKVD